MYLKGVSKQVLVGVLSMENPRTLQYPPPCECCKEYRTDTYLVNVPALMDNGWLTKVMEEYNQTTCTQ